MFGTPIHQVEVVLEKRILLRKWCSNLAVRDSTVCRSCVARFMGGYVGASMAGASQSVS